MSLIRRRLRRLFVLTILAGVIYLISTGSFVQKKFYPQKFSDPVFQYAEVNNLDPYLIFSVIRAESKFNPQAESFRGARGLMQLMPDTAQWVALLEGIAYEPNLLFIPDYNIRLGCRYLRDLIAQFQGDIIPALASYNAGPNKVGRWLQEGVWDGTLENMELVPYLETRIYLKRVMHNYRRYRELYRD